MTFYVFFLIVFSITFFYPKRYRNIPQRAPKSHQTAPQNHQKSSPANSLGKTSKKSGKTLAPSCPSGRPHMQSAHACAVQTQFSILSPRPKKQKQKLKLPPKNIKKSSKILPKSTPEPIKNRAQNKRCEKPSKTPKTQKNGPQTGTKPGGNFSKNSFFFASRTPWGSKWTPGAQKGHPGSPKSPKWSPKSPK